jgi:hypothetical protein
MLAFRHSSKCDEDIPLTWRNYIDPGGTVLECSPVIVDIKGHFLSIHKHSIAQDGTVSPSVVCPVEKCGFHEFIRLEGWMGSKVRKSARLF